MSVAELRAVTGTAYEGLDLLSTAVLLLDGSARIVHVNQAAELLFDASRRTLIGQPAGRLLGDETELSQLINDAKANAFGQRKQILELRHVGRDPIPVRVVATAQYADSTPLVLEVSEIEQQLKVDREERQLGLTDQGLARSVEQQFGGLVDMDDAGAAIEQQHSGRKQVKTFVGRSLDQCTQIADAHRAPRSVRRAWAAGVKLLGTQQRQFAAERTGVVLGTPDVFLQALHALAVERVVALITAPLRFAVVVLGLEPRQALFLGAQFVLENAAAI